MLKRLALAVLLIPAASFAEKRLGDEAALFRAAASLVAKRRLSKEDHAAVRDAMLQLAAEDERLRRSLLFCAGATFMAEESKRKKGDIFQMLMSEQQLLLDFGRLDEQFVSERHLPNVRYEFARHDFEEAMVVFDGTYVIGPETQDITLSYERLRRRGMSRWEAYDTLMESPCVAEYQGWVAVRDQLFELGQATLFGYGPQEAVRDVPEYLEACYAFHFPSEPDVAGLLKARLPSTFVAYKVRDALWLDLSHVRASLEAAVDAAIERLAKARERESGQGWEGCLVNPN